MLIFNIVGEELWWRGYIFPRQEKQHGRFTWVLHGLLWTLFHAFKWWDLIGLVPGFFLLTANLNTTLSCAIVVVFATHVIGIKHHGAKYVKHFMGPMLAMAPLALPVVRPRCVLRCLTFLGISMICHHRRDGTWWAPPCP